ncbi:MAG: prepilin-type N-terminal cleavage/methylation domain-containing protein [Dehalococcoidia bacterium]|nr:prepilin-type N-terminal cleavage/methylation domain-containing protein [Dehalococcoidia bacterium]
MKLKTTEKGFTLIEMLVALAILGAIMGVMSAAVVIIMKTGSQNNEWNVNLHQVQNAGHWISRDALMAQVVNTNKPGVFLNLSWSDWDSNNYSVDYIFDGNTLKRQLNGGAAVLIAEYVVTDVLYTNCNWNDDDKKLTVNIRAALHANGRYAERTYEISPRPMLRGG